MTHDSSDTGTIDHLPECIHPQQDYPCAWCQEIDCECPCICDRLRACEQRVLKAAQEAITRTCHHNKYEGCRPCSHDTALVAIDAIRQLPPPTAHYDPAAKDNRP